MPADRSVSVGTPPVAAGPRPAWSDLPEALREWTATQLGTPVVDATTQRGGFSPGVAARLRCAHGERAFIKAAAATSNPQTLELHRGEAAVLSALPAHPALPALIGVYDDGGWVALLLRDIDGRQPTLPWRADELHLVLDTVGALAGALTPSPASSVPSAAAAFNSMLTRWAELATDPPGDLDPWLRHNLDSITGLAEQPVEPAGESLVHLDLRADNLLVARDGRVHVVDWAHAAVGEPWMDVVLLLLEVNAHGGHNVERIVASHPLIRDVAPARVTQAVLAACGMFQARCRAPSPPGLPTIRAFQRAYADATAEWLRRRLTHAGFGSAFGR